MLNFYFLNQFKKDLKLAEKRRCSMDEMNEIIAKITFLRNPCLNAAALTIFPATGTTLSIVMYRTIGFWYTVIPKKVLFFPVPEPIPTCFSLMSFSPLLPFAFRKAPQ